VVDIYLSDIDVTLHDGIVGSFMDTAGFHSQEGRLKEGLWATEPLVSDGNHLTVGKFIGFLKRA